MTVKMPTYPAMSMTPAVTGSGIACHTSHRRVLLFLGIGLLVAIGAVAGIAALVAPAVAIYHCPPQCGSPPQGTPQDGLPVFAGADNSFTVEYYPESPDWHAGTDASGVTDERLTGAGGALRMFGTAAGGRTAQQVVTALVQQAYPNATQRYQLTNAMVGYQLGYGEVDEIIPQSSDGSYQPQSLVVMASVKGDVALVGEAIGPYQPWDPDTGPWDGHPSGVAMAVAGDLDQLINSFSWAGDPAR
ncbi:hypothetical protein SAMN04515671_3599 [Nakamurella panacisegetis]|uniref:Uncharacterized protein n=1 Tax=Nakamurella panacisegetis TaxID=1090615 RepID=A0A1H0RJ46_9ACTN|nr:hypothetical protein [Nakamurella panacisegetis]SDP29455.1 hypothetical protein SAMN04515671_3599 [Nakamurella panacisegetis]